jgi:hypothetical protein
MEQRANQAHPIARPASTSVSHFDENLDRSVRIAPGRWERRPLRQQIAERLVAPFRHLT